MLIIKNEQGAATWLFIVFSLVIIANLSFYLNSTKNNLEIVESTEERQKIKFFRSYIENLIYNPETCNEIFLGDQIDYIALDEPFGSDLYGLRKETLGFDGSVVVREGEVFDRKNNIRILKMAVILDEDPKLDTTRRYFYSGNFRIYLTVDGREYIETFPITFKVAYEVEVQAKVNDYVPHSEIIAEFLQNCRDHPEFPDSTHHDDSFTIENLRCDMNYPQKFCLGNCLFKRTDNENRILKCAM